MKATLLFLLSLLLVGSLPTEGALPSSIFTGCDNTTTCFMVRPTSCNTECTGPDCNLVAIIENIPSQNKFRIQLYSDQNYAYMAIGFSLDQLMGSTDVVGCDRSDANTAHVKDTYNDGRSNFLDSNQSSISNFTYNIDGSNFSCTFYRAYQPADGRGEALNSRSFFLFLGARTSGMFGFDNDRFNMHSSTPCISSAQVDLLTPSPVVSTGRSVALVLAHGMLMLFAWAVLVVIAVFTAGYTKYIFPNGEWFQVHRFINSFAVLIALVAFILVFVSVRGWSEGSNDILAHQVFGIIAMVVILLNPLLAVFRCRPKSEYRWVFNCLHSGLGSIGLTCAMVAIGMGLAIYYRLYLNKGILQAIAFWVYIGWMVTIIIFNVALAIYRVVKCIKVRSRDQDKLLKEHAQEEISPLKVLVHNILGIPLCPPKGERKKPAKEWPIIGGLFCFFILCSLLYYAACVLTIVLIT